jgi:hypothetical protein
MWRQQAAADATRWHWRYVDEDIPSLMKQAIRFDPFTIRRRELAINADLDSDETACARIPLTGSSTVPSALAAGRFRFQLIPLR